MISQARKDKSSFNIFLWCNQDHNQIIPDLAPKFTNVKLYNGCLQVKEVLYKFSSLYSIIILEFIQEYCTNSQRAEITI